MSADPRKRQKKQQRRAAKRKEKHHELVRAKSKGLAAQFSEASHCPILNSWLTETLWSEGLGWAAITRELPNGAVAVAIFLVDRYCLGVKNVLARIMSRFEYESEIERRMARETGAKPASPAAVRKLVEGSVEYARSLGFHPHADYAKARLIFGDINPAEAWEEFEFGKDGKPLFIAGPHDTPNRCRMILSTLERAAGPGGYHYLMPVSGDQLVRAEDMPDDFDWEQIEDHSADEGDDNESFRP
jgi:hypothetical protein